MSSIKPPDGRGAVGGVPTAPGQAPFAAAPAGADFREALARAEGAAAAEGAQAASGPAAALGSDPLGELAGLVRSGALTPDQALDRLLDRALGQVGRGLSEAQRAELAVVLRTALEADPGLQALRSELGR